MKKITEGEEFQMATGIFVYSKNPDNTISLKLIRKAGEKKSKQPPTYEEVKAFFVSEGYPESLAQTFYKGYQVNDWKDSNDKPIKNWKLKAIQVWMKPDQKTKDPKSIKFFHG